MARVFADSLRSGDAGLPQRRWGNPAAGAGSAAPPQGVYPPLITRPIRCAEGLLARQFLAKAEPSAALLEDLGSLQKGQPHWGRQRMGYLLPPPGAMPLLHRALERERRLPLHSCAELDHRSWLQQLRGELLLLPSHPTVLHLPGWRDAGLVLRQPLQPLIESLWVLLRRSEAERPELAALLAWWGGRQLRRPQLEKRPRIRQWPGLGGLWRWR